MRILVTNDDGIDAKGIEILAGAAKHFGDVWVVAPDHQCSAMSQRITLKEKLLVTEYGIPSIAFSNEATHIYDTVNEYITRITEEIIKRGFRDDSIWNVNFPACSVSECKGVLWDRKIARSPLFQGSFAEEESDGNGRKITAVGTKKDLSYLSDETDLGAVTRKYISVGYVKSMVLMKDSTINIEGETDGIQ